jgi:uncharacterized protein (TIGR02646 family)
VRPVDRGEANREYKEHSEASLDLIERIGRFCSYCEMPLPNSPHVEHIRPQKHYPELATKWDNFLLSCAYCNSRKKDKNFSLDEVCLPDTDNTFLAFSYYKGGIVKINSSLNEQQQQLATATMRLMKLDSHPGLIGKEPTGKDPRYQFRITAWNKAVRAKDLRDENHSKKVEDSIVDTMESTGFWSVWMTVFDDDTHMRQRFIDVIQGTHKDSFDADTKPLPRGKI